MTNELTTGEKIARDLCEMDVPTDGIEVDPVDVARRIDDELDELIDQLTATRTALAAAEADNERLRDAAAVTEQAITKAHYGCVNVAARELCDEARPFAKISMASLDVALKATSEALAQPRDDSALREMIAGVYEECKKIVEQHPHEEYWEITERIHALAEKAKGE